MPGYVLTDRARQDALAIWRYIARDSVHHADRFIDRLTTHFRLLGDNPYLGRSRDELRKGLRGFPVSEFLILYRVGEASVEILHTAHGRQKLADLFDD